MTESHQLIKWLKAISILAILWNLIRIYNYLQGFLVESEIKEPMIVTALLAERKQDVFFNILSTSFNIFIGVALLGGLIASILLLFKKRFATSLFMVSFIALITLIVLHYVILKHINIGFSYSSIPFMELIISLFFLWYSRKMDEYAVLS